MKFLIINMVLIFFSMQVFAKDVNNFIGGAAYYNSSDITFKDQMSGEEVIIPNNNTKSFGYGFSYDMLKDNFLFQLNTKFDSKNHINTTENVMVDSGFNFMFNYLSTFKSLNDRSGLFVGLGVGYGSLMTMQQQSNATNYILVRQMDDYVSFIANLGFMQTLERVPMMWNISVSYNYNSPTNNYTLTMVEKYNVIQAKLGLSYAF